MRTTERARYDSEKGLLTSLLNDERRLTETFYLKMSGQLSWQLNEKDATMRKFQCLQERIKSQSQVVDSLKEWACA